MTEDINQRIKEKISKCLALAKSSNPHEAEIAWRQAKALMAAHNLGRADIIASAAVTSRFDIGVCLLVWLIKLANTCAHAFLCWVITEKIVRKEAVIIGVGNQPGFAAYTFDVLHRQLIQDRRNFVSAMSSRCRFSSKRRQGEVFSEHWVQSVRSVLAKFAEIDEESNEIIAAYIEKQYPEVTNKTLETRKVTKRDVSAAYAGRNAGANAKIHKAMTRDHREQLELLG